MLSGAAQPFQEMVRHFFGRFFDKESLSPQGRPEAGLSQVLGMLVPPGGFVCLLSIVMDPRGWDLVGMRFMFINFSMIAMGIVMVFEWDALFLDRRDYLVLTPLPLRVFDLFVAKFAALGIFLFIFLVAVNSLGVLFWPAIEPSGGALRIMGAHLLVVAAAGLLSAVTIAALHGVLVTVFRGAAYRRASVIAQTGVMALLIMLLFLTPLMGTSLPRLCRMNSPLLRWYPGYWFAGWYEHLRPVISHMRRPSPSTVAAGRTLAGLATMAVPSVWIAVAVFTASFLPDYRSHARRALEIAEPNPRGPGLERRMLAAGLRRLLPDPVEYGVFEFIGQTIARSLKHRLFLATYGGLGAAIVVMMLASGGWSNAVPLMLSFILISGLRAAFNFPSDLRANWAFQVSETSSVAAYVRGTRKWVILYAILPLLLLVAGSEAFRLPWTAVAFHFAFGATFSIVLMETLFLGFHKVPFTCSYFPGKVNLVFLSVLYLFGFTFYSHYAASLEEWLWRIPQAAALFFPMIAGVLFLLVRTRERMLSSETRLEYEEDGNPVVCTLGITEP
jgi:hypothetical protein